MTNLEWIKLLEKRINENKDAQKEVADMLRDPHRMVPIIPDFLNYINQKYNLIEEQPQPCNNFLEAFE